MAQCERASESNSNEASCGKHAATWVARDSVLVLADVGILAVFGCLQRGNMRILAVATCLQTLAPTLMRWLGVRRWTLRERGPELRMDPLSSKLKLLISGSFSVHPIAVNVR